MIRHAFILPVITTMSSKRTSMSNIESPKRARLDISRKHLSQSTKVSDLSTEILAAEQQLITALDGLAQTYRPPVTHVYNPLKYAWSAHSWYVQEYGSTSKRVLFVSMNPGPWGMVQTGIPFGDITMVREWMRVPTNKLKIGRPKHENKNRPVKGWDIERGEISGQRIWGWARDRYGKNPMGFFKWAYVHNYCPLVWMNKNGKNITPVNLKKDEREKIERPCNDALEKIVNVLKPELIIGIGGYAYDRCVNVFGKKMKIAKILHPSPANPKANQTKGGWGAIVDEQLTEIFGDKRLDVM